MATVSKKKNIRRDNSGAVGVPFGLLVVPMVMLVGGAVDIGRAVHARSQLQLAADAGALAAATSTSVSQQERITLATSMVDGNASTNVLRGVNRQVTLGDAVVTVEASANVATNFLGIMGLDQIQISVHSVAKSSYEPSDSSTDLGKICLLALDPDSSDGIHVQGDNDVSYPNCWAYTNSTRFTAINGDGSNAAVVGEGHCAVGGYDALHENFSPKPKTACVTANDPFATVGAYSGGTYASTFTAPTKPADCMAHSLNLKKGTYTLQPGRYCGGITLQAQAKVTLLPGEYYIDDGLLSVQSGSWLQGSDVLLYFAGINSRMTIIGGGTINLKGRSAGSSYAGFLAIAHPDAWRGRESNIQGGGMFNMEGVIYMPTQRMEVSGNGDVNGSSAYFAMIAKDFYFRGNGKFYLKRNEGGSTLPNLLPDMPRQQSQDAFLKE